MILDRGAQEPLKAAVHGGLFALATVCAAYNAAAYLKRQELHLLRNAAMYGVITAFEARKVRHHLAEPDA